MKISYFQNYSHSCVIISLIPSNEISKILYHFNMAVKSKMAAKNQDGCQIVNCIINALINTIFCIINNDWTFFKLQRYFVLFFACLFCFILNLAPHNLLYECYLRPRGKKGRVALSDRPISKNKI